MRQLRLALSVILLFLGGYVMTQTMMFAQGMWASLLGFYVLLAEIWVKLDEVEEKL